MAPAALDVAGNERPQAFACAQDSGFHGREGLSGITRRIGIGRVQDNALPGIIQALPAGRTLAICTPHGMCPAVGSLTLPYRWPRTPTNAMSRTEDL